VAHDVVMVRPVLLIAFPDVQVLDVAGPLEVFSVATMLLAARGSADGYATQVVSRQTPTVITSSGLPIGTKPLPSGRTAVHTLLVAGGIGHEAAAADPLLIRWLQASAPRSERLVSVCTGAFVLAAAGLLDGRRATTHWSACERLARCFPDVTVEPDRIFVRDGTVSTSAGVTAGIDLALALVDEDHGPELALEVARWLVVFLKRPGGQSQFSGHLAAQVAQRAPLREVQAWVAAHLDADLSVPALARRVGMSSRNFARSFRREVGLTPGEYVESKRVAAARHWLEATDESINAIARRCGYRSVETMYRAFQRRLHVSPADYRTRFRTETTALNS
jgi:transcriptional regulator GlxA family with amidase domain